MSVACQSFGGLRSAARALHCVDRHQGLPRTEAPMLPLGRGQSYGDECLLDDGVMLDTRRLSRLMAFDEGQGVLRAEAGITLSEILDFTVPRGWFLPVVPGTAGISLGGAIANDVHGKNHHVAGSFGHHVRELELLRSDGARIRATPDRDAEWFTATIGGAGLTGLITWAELQLRRVAGTDMEVLECRFDSFEEFLRLADRHDREFEYSVAWIDGLARGRVRGVYGGGNHAQGSTHPAPGRPVSVPAVPPFSLVRRTGLRAYNAWRYRRARPGRATRSHFRNFLFPLDGLAHWNRLYGRAGFLQYQCVVPDPDVAARVLELASWDARGPALVVAKRFGERVAPGMLSFARPGVTLALDFAERGSATAEMFERLDAEVARAGGAVYLAKDACQSRDLFAAAYPALARFRALRDPGFDSNLWRRLA